MFSRLKLLSTQIKIFLIVKAFIIKLKLNQKQAAKILFGKESYIVFTGP